MGGRDHLGIGGRHHSVMRGDIIQELGAASSGISSSSIEVSVSTVDQFVRERSISRVDMVKIDVEGFEPGVISGARQTIERLQPVVFVEVNSFTLIAYRNFNPRAFVESMMSIFPFVYWFDHGTPKRLHSDDDLLGFIHDHLIKRGCVDDPFCTFSPLA
jgi:Methyltransferase FkbM domain